MLNFQKINQFEGFELNKVLTLSAAAGVKNSFYDRRCVDNAKSEFEPQAVGARVPLPIYHTPRVTKTNVDS